MSLGEAAETLGVHYMTAYRYVRLGMLPATKSGNAWRVLATDVAAMRPAGDAVSPATTPRRGATDWSGRLRQRLLAGDEPGSWGVVEAAMAAGSEPIQIYEDVLAPAMSGIGRDWELGHLDVADEHQSTAVATRIVARLGPRFRRRGRRRGRVIVTTPSGELHALAPAIVSDVIRSARFDVTDLGCNVPAQSLARTIEGTADLVAVAVSATCSGDEHRIADTLEAARAAGDVPVIAGGAGFHDAEGAASVGADYWCARASDILPILDTLTTP